MNFGQLLLIIATLTQGSNTIQKEETQETCHRPPCATKYWEKVKFEITNDKGEEQFTWCTLVPPSAADVIEKILKPSLKSATKKDVSRISSTRLKKLLEEQTNFHYCNDDKSYTKQRNLSYSSGRGKEQHYFARQ